MPGWTLVDTHPTQGRTFQRPLYASELGFVLDGRFNGTADSMQHVQVRLVRGSRDTDLFSDANIVRAWMSTKRRYPLAGAIVQGASPSRPLLDGLFADSKAGTGGDNGTWFPSEHHFIVRERDLASLRPGEIVFAQVADLEEAQRQVLAILDGPCPLSDELLVRLYAFRETGAEGTEKLHLITLMAHCVTDEIANRTFMRCLLDTLARGGRLDSEPAQMPLEERLEMAVHRSNMDPVYLGSLSPAKRRWRKAAGFMIHQLRMAKMQGGHTLPCRLTRSTPHVPARSRLISTLLTHGQSAIVISNCRLHDITFGQAYQALAQVAMTRVLYRRYLRGEISGEEWAYRKRQPHIIGCVFNLRPYLDRTWFDNGGGGEFMLTIGFFVVKLPFMTLGTTAEQERILSDGAPPFSDLLTFGRFLYRAGLIKKQTRAFFSHPLFFEIVSAAYLGDPGWMKLTETVNGTGVHKDAGSDEVLEVKDIPMVRAHGGSSLGNVDLISPSEYPLPPTHPLSPYSSVPHPVKAGYVIPASPPPSTSEANTTPKIIVEYSRAHLHTRPAELYLGAATKRGQLILGIFYDENVFEGAVVREWLDEVKGAVLWYLGRAHQSRRSGRDGQAGNASGGVHAKL